MKIYEVVGYADVEGCETYCTICGDPNTMEPITAGSEWDYYPSCDKCGGVIDEVSLTEDGERYEAQQFEKRVKEAYGPFIKVEQPQYVVNPDDLMDVAPDLNDGKPRPFYDGVYVVRLTRFGTSFLVNADNEQDALDEVVDYIEDHSDKLGGLLLSDSQVEEYEEDGRLYDYFCGGNGGRYLSTLNIRIETIRL